MTAIICIDSNMGIAFNGMRVSSDRCQKEHMLGYAESHGVPLIVSEHSHLSMQKYEELISTDWKTDFSKDDIVLFEDIDISGYWEQIDKLIVYNWNRVYPADKVLSFPANHSFIPVRLDVFPGKSHDNISVITYIKIN